MAKRTHWVNGYKKRKRKRGVPQFQTIDAYNEWIAEKKRTGLAKNPNKKIVEPKPEVLKVLECLQEELRRTDPASDAPP